MDQQPAEQMEFNFMGRGVVVEELRRKTARLAGASRAARTVEAYASDWSLFSRWCAEFGRAVMPATAETVALFLAEHQTVWRVATLERRVAAIGAQHRKMGAPDPSKDEMVRGVLRGLKRSDRRAPAAKAALSVAELRRLVACARKAATPRGERDAAILLLGFAGGFRRGELAGLDLADVHIERRGLVAVVRRSKTDQLGVGRAVPVVRGLKPELCPVAAVQRWIRERGPWDGPLFVRIDERGAVRRERLSGQWVARVVQTTAAAAGLDPAKYGGHSLRAGLVTAAHLAGKADSSIMLTTGHRSVATLTRYMRGADVFKRCAGRGLL